MAKTRIPPNANRDKIKEIYRINLVDKYGEDFAAPEKHDQMYVLCTFADITHILRKKLKDRYSYSTIGSYATQIRKQLLPRPGEEIING